ncbi:MAG: ATP-binding protein [Spirochaetia bacterium]|jgi:signal transduction histidine kinase
MKLFTKTLLFFIGVIAFQAVLTILLITNVAGRANLADARKEMGNESAVLYDDFNAWKRQIWINLIAIGNNSRPALSAALEGRASLMELLFMTKVDALGLKDANGNVSDLEQTQPRTFTISDIQALDNLKPHPYIQLLMIRGALCMVGVRAVDLPGAGHADVFLLKRVDPDFCGLLTRNRKSAVAFLRGTSVLASTLPYDTVVSFFNPTAMPSAYKELYNQRMAGRWYNAAFQRLGRLDHQQEGEELFLVTFLSNEPYIEKLLLLDRAILTVSLAGALLTVLLSLFFSRNITYPIAELLGAMGRIRDGILDTRVGTRGGYEISRLFHGFNDMARELAQSRAASREALRETVILKEYNEKIVNSIRAGIAIINRDLVVEKANSSFLSSFGLDGARAIGSPLTYLNIDIIDEIIVERIFAIFRREIQFHSQISRSRTGMVYEIRLYPFYSPDGEIQQASGCVFMVDDISARTELEEKIFQAEKLSTISMLSAGMAHEINNPLGSMLTNVQNLIEEESDPDRRVSLKWIEQETRRIARIVQELLNFASADSGQAPGSDVNDVVREVVGLVSHSLAREGSIRIDTRLASGLPFSTVSTDELKQVVINLLKNSLQAIAAEGRVVVSTRRIADNGIALVIADTGVGIPKEIIPRIFDPFFTTKANGTGTGLGLSVVYGIVAKYSGSIDVRSRVGKGTRFALRLPCLVAHAEALPSGGVA